MEHYYVKYCDCEFYVWLILPEKQCVQTLHYIRDACPVAKPFDCMTYNLRNLTYVHMPYVYPSANEATLADTVEYLKSDSYNLIL